MKAPRSPWSFAACWSALLLAMAGCGPEARNSVDGVQVFDDAVQLVRGERSDSARREVTVSADSTMVAFVYEDDCDVAVMLEAVGFNGAPDSVEVENLAQGESLEIATLDASRNSRFVIRLKGGQDRDRPCRVRTRLVRFEASGRSSRIEARLSALRAWTSGTRIWTSAMHTDDSHDELIDAALRSMDAARAYFAATGGDAGLAAWARLVRAHLQNARGIDVRLGAAEAARAADEFAALGESRNEGRGRLLRAALLVDVATDKAARDPTAAEAARELESTLPALRRHPALSPLERARATNYLALHMYNLGRLDQAGSLYRAALAEFEATHNLRGRLMVRSNLGVLAAELGEYLVATHWFDQVVPQIDRLATDRDRVLYLMNAARADTNAGFIDRAIERLQLARQLNADSGERWYEANLLHALGRAYWGRGDMTQAAVYFREALRLRRESADPIGLMASLRYAGIIERDAGRIDEAIRMHREAVALSISDDLRLRGLFDLAFDYAAIPDHGRAIAICREALALPLTNPEFYKRYEMQLALGELLLDQQAAGTEQVREAQALATQSLAAALRRFDTSMEIAARHLRARSFAAGGKRNLARTEYEQAIDLVFRYSSTSTNPELQAYTLAREQATFRGYLDLMMSESARSGGGLRPASPAEIEALRTIEWARARSLAGSQAAILDVKSAAQVDVLLAQMAGKRVRIAALVERAGDASREMDSLQLDIAKMRTEIDRIRARAQPASANGPTAGIPALSALPDGVAQWSFAFGNAHAYLWVREGDEVRTAVLPASATELLRRLAALNASLTRGAPDSGQALGQLASTIIPRGALTSDARTLEIVADGRISSLPFAALPQVGHRPIIMVSSAFGSSGQVTRGSRALRFLGVAGTSGAARSDSARVFPALGSTVREARSVAAMFERSRSDPGVKLLLGNDGSSATLAKFWRAGIDVLHVATHGLADLRQPMTSLLMLPANDASGNATYLTAGQVQEWRGDADLVYLSACETAVGPARFADGMPGLQRAFLHAGARGVIATLWPIEDVYASQFATDFYRKYTTGMPASRALAETQRTWMQPLPGLRASEQSHRNMTAWAHAYYTQ